MEYGQYIIKIGTFIRILAFVIKEIIMCAIRSPPQPPPRCLTEYFFNGFIFITKIVGIGFFIIQALKVLRSIVQCFFHVSEESTGTNLIITDTETTNFTSPVKDSNVSFKEEETPVKLLIDEEQLLEEKTHLIEYEDNLIKDETELIIDDIQLIQNKEQSINSD